MFLTVDRASKFPFKIPGLCLVAWASTPLSSGGEVVALGGGCVTCQGEGETVGWTNAIRFVAQKRNCRGFFVLFSSVKTRTKNWKIVNCVKK